MNSKLFCLYFLFLTIYNTYNIHAQPTLVEPKSGFVTINTSVNFIWNKVQTATNYDIQIDDDSLFLNPVQHQQTGLLVNSYSASLPQYQKYYWRVRYNNGGNPSLWSDVWNIELYNLSANSNLVLWLKTDAGVVTDTANKVTLWGDQSVNAHLGAPVSTNNAPVLSGQIPLLNNQKAISFDGVNDYIRIPHHSSLDLGTEESVFFMGNFKNNTLGFFAKRGNPPEAGIEFRKSGSNLVFVHFIGNPNRNVNVTVLYPTSYNYLTLTRNNTSALYKKNGAYNLLGLGTPSVGVNVNNSLQPLLIGSGRLAGDFFDGDFSEILTYNVSLDSATIILIEKYLRYKYAPPVNLGEDVVVQTGFCDTITLNASDRFVSYLWGHNGATTSTIEVTSAGNYRITATDVFGNISYDTVKVTYPNIVIPQITAYCKNDSIEWNTNLSTADYNFEWSTIATTNSIYISTPGNYWVKVTEKNNPSCFVTSNTINFQQDTFQDFATLGPDVTLCSGNSIGLVNGAALTQSYLWAPGGETTPTIVVFTSGDYTLTATSVNGCVVEDTINITITGTSPTVNFSVLGSCRNDSVFFTNLSQPVLGDPITNYEWDFGDNTFSTDTHPTHIYTTSGNFIVKLETFTSIGCSFIHADTIYIYDTPTAYHEELEGCSNTIKSFTNLSVPGNLDTISSYYWNFGDNTFTLSQNPTHTYANTGQFTIMLAINTVYGCKDTFISQINILPPVDSIANFTLIAPNNNINLLLQDSITFVWNQPQNVLFYELQVSSSSDFSTILNTYGPLINDSLKVLGASSWSPIIYWRIIAYNLCEVPTYSNVYSINFLVTPGNLVMWVMGDKNITTTNPPFVDLWSDNSGNGNHVAQSDTFKRPTKNIRPKINNKPSVTFDGLNDFLSVTHNPSQNFVSEITALYVMKTDSSIPSQAFFAKRLDGGTDAGITYSYSNARLLNLVHQGQTQNAADRVTMVSPFFDDWNMVRIRRANTSGSVFLNSVQRQSTITVAASGVNTSSQAPLSIGVANGQQSGFFSGEIAEILLFSRSINNVEALAIEDYLNDKYAPPVNLGPDIYIKYGLCYNIVLDASERYLPDSYRWSNGETTSSININQSGTYSVTVTNIFGRISSDTVIVDIPGLVSPPSDTFCLGATMNWNIPLDTSLYSFVWSTGSTDSFITISDPGEYWVKITDTAQCLKQDTFIIATDSFETFLYIGPDDSLCQGNSIKLLSGQQPGVSYLWSDNTTADSVFISATGDYSVTAINSNGCVGIDTVFVQVLGVAPNVEFNFYDTCFGDSTLLDDSTSSNDTIVAWNWKFGDNDSSNLENPLHKYGAEGSYLVTLTVTSDVGCFATGSKYVDINPKPIPDFTSSVSCAATETQFFGSATIPGSVISRPDKWFWNFGTGDTDTLQNPKYIFPGQGEYQVTLTSISDRGCYDSITKTVEVFKELIADFETTGVTCIGDSTGFVDKTNSFSIVKYLWEFFDDNTITSTIKNPSYTFSGTGTYNVKLTVTNAIGCISDTVKEVTIFDAPVADFNFVNNCIGQLTHFTDTSDAKGDTMWKHFWNFGDSTPTVRAINPIYIYDSVGTYNVTHSIVTVSGCEASVAKDVTIVSSPLADFSYSPDFGAAPLPVNFVNESSADAISFLWNFGDADSSVSQEENPTHTYTADNIYTAKLLVSNSSGCTDSITKNIKVAKATLDIAVKNITVQQDLMNDGNYKLITVAEIQNLGTRNVMSFDITCITGTQPAILESWEGFLAAGGSIVNYAFASSFISLEEENTTYVCVETLYPNGEEDENKSNDKLCVALEDKIKVIPPYPSPGKGTLYFGVILPRKDKLEITMFNAIGAEIFTSNNEYAKGYNRIQFERSGLAKGVYIIRIKFGEDTYTEKFFTE